MGSKKREAGLPQHRSIDIGDATLECTLRGSGAPVVLLANAGCSTGYFEQLAHRAEQDRVDLVALQMVGEFAGMGLHLYGIAGAHKRVMRLGNRADRAVGGK